MRNSWEWILPEFFRHANFTCSCTHYVLLQYYFFNQPTLSIWHHHLVQNISFCFLSWTGWWDQLHSALLTAARKLPANIQSAEYYLYNFKWPGRQPFQNSLSISSLLWSCHLFVDPKLNTSRKWLTGDSVNSAMDS